MENSLTGRRESRTRMKKVAPPPPPPPVVAKQPPLSNGNLVIRRESSGPPPLTTTPGEDCAIDELLEGRMDLEVVLPDLKVVKMTVDRRTPMMDLLVQAATSNKISPSGHVIKVISREERNVNYKPNTPIGSLDANTVYIVPKSTLEAPVKRMPKLANQPFEQQTFRLQVNLPLNQRMVLRVSPRITLAELKQQICTEKELDHSSHHLVHPAQPDTVLDLNATLEVYGCAEISLMSNSGLRDSIRNTSTNLFAYPKVEEEKKKKGILRLFSRKKKDFTVETPIGTNGLTSSQSEHSSLNRNNYQPKQSIKRKPAPAPPPPRNSSPPLITQSSNSINSRPESEISVKTVDEIESSVSHSRHSSDSSGYHEPSVFSDCSENKSPEASIVHGDTVSVNDALRQGSPSQKDFTDSNVQIKRSSMTAKETNLKSVPSGSNTSIMSASRKRKAPQPPVSNLPAIESPSSPEAPPIDSITSELTDAAVDIVAPNSSETSSVAPNSSEKSSESEAIKYLEDVLQESETSVKNFAMQTMMDDSDTDSQRDETEVISVCQAEVHANDQDSSDSVVELQTLVIPDPALSSLASQSAPNPQPDRCEAVDTFADDSGISHSLNSDAESSVPSLNSDLKTLSDSGCHEEIYCNVTGGVISTSLSTPVISSPRPGVECKSNAPIPLPRMSLKRKALTSMESLNSSIYPSSDSLDAKSVPSSEEFPVQDCIISKEEEISIKEPDVEILDDENSPGTVTATSDDSTNSDANNATERTVLVSDDQLSNYDEKFSTTEVSTADQKLISDLEDSKESKCDNVCSDKISVISSISTDSAHGSVSNTPPAQRKLDNFALGCYKKEQNIDIYSAHGAELKLVMEDKTQSEISSLTREIVKPLRKSKLQPDVKITSFKERNQADVSETAKGNVQEKCSQLSSMSTLPLTGRSSSLFNLVPKQKMEVMAIETESLPEVADDSLKRTQSDQNIAKELEPHELKASFIQEQKRLQEEYLRLQEKFLSWQKQLLSNQNLLQNEEIVSQIPQMPFPSLESMNLETLTKKTASENVVNHKPDNNINFNDYRTRSLPRPKTKSLSLKESSQEKQSSPIRSPIKASVVEIDISSQETPKRPDTLEGCSVDTQATIDHDDKNVQVPSPQDKVTSGTQAPSPENVISKETSAQTSDTAQVSSPEVSSISDSAPSPDSDSSKSQTLPRPKSKPVSALQQPSQTMTLNRNTRSKLQAVSVTIGSWQQRQATVTDIEASSIASSRSKFKSLETIPQNISKPIPSSIEKRKLPPVPTENDSSRNTLPKSIVKPLEPKIEVITVPKSVPTNPKTKPPVQRETNEYGKTVTVGNTNEVTKTVPKMVERVPQKQKMEIKLSSREPTATFKQAKPFVKLSSMKDEPHQASIVGLRKWPLSNISESPVSGDGKQSILDDLRSSSKKPGGFVQEKIRRAEVDLRKPKSVKPELPASNVQLKSSKTESLTSPKETIGDTSKLHISKISIKNSNTLPDSNITAVKEISTTSDTVNNTYRNTIPKSQSLNSELLSVFSRKSSKDSGEQPLQKAKVNGVTNTVTVNGGVQSIPPPPPPPPPQSQSQTVNSTMPTIPPAEQIPISSQLLMAGSSKTLPAKRKDSKKSPNKHSKSSDPREELMLEIRGFGGKQALRTLYEKSCLTFLKKSPKKKMKEDSGSSSHQQ